MAEMLENRAEHREEEMNPQKEGEQMNPQKPKPGAVELTEQQGSDMISTKTSERPHPSLEVFVEGMSTLSEEQGAPIYLEYYEGKWWMRIWADINSQDPTHSIDMSGALDKARDAEA